MTKKTQSIPKYVMHIRDDINIVDLSVQWVRYSCKLVRIAITNVFLVVIYKIAIFMKNGHVQTCKRFIMDNGIFRSPGHAMICVTRTGNKKSILAGLSMRAARRMAAYNHA